MKTSQNMVIVYTTWPSGHLCEIITQLLIVENCGNKSVQRTNSKNVNMYKMYIQCILVGILNANHY
jgi:hypothetical protein